MKKYGIMILKLIMYIGIMYGMIQLVGYLFYKVLSQNPGFKSFIDQNFPVFILSFFALTVLSYALIFKLQRKSLLKTCNFSGLSLKNVKLCPMMAFFGAIAISSVVGMSFISKSYPELDSYLKTFYDNKSVLLIAVVLMMPLCEEIVFRGVIFNEMRDKMPVMVALVLQGVVYGVFALNIPIGLFAVVCSIIYCIPYIYTGTLWSSVLVQIVGIVTMMIYRQSGLKNMFIGFGDAVLAGIFVISFCGLALSVYLLKKNCQGQDSAISVKTTA